jgi:hypothetical protein
MATMADELRLEKEKTNQLLSELLPPTVAEALKQGGFGASRMFIAL